MKLELATINKIALEFLGQYRRKLMDDNKRATGQLINDTAYVVEYDGRYLIVSLNLPDEWKYVEYGRKPGKFPPINAIRQWIRVKPILPRPYKGKVPTENQLAYLIGRKIAKDGIPTGNYLSNTIRDFDIKGKVYDEVVRLMQDEWNKD